MKSLSIKQPWASLIAEGIKDVENRSWRTHFRGRIYIHASGKWFDKPNKTDENHGGIYTDAQWKNIIDEYQKSLISILEPKATIDQLKTSAIIGEVDIVDCVINHDSIWADHMQTYKCEDTGLNILDRGQKYIWNWVLANPVVYDKPILNVKGKLSFWEYEKVL